MKWLLLILVFNIADDQITVVDQEYQVFASEQACNAAGKKLQSTTEYPGRNLRSMSICIPQHAFGD